MQNLGLLTTLLPWLNRQERDTEQDRLFCRRYYEFFNTNPYLANFLVGGLLRLESERRDGGGLPPGLSQTFRDSLGRAFASIGDQLFWLGLRPAATMAICLLGLNGLWPAVLVLVAAFALWQMALRWYSLGRGYRLGMDIIEVLDNPVWHRAVALATRSAVLLTGMLMGCYLTRVSGVAEVEGGRILLIGAIVGLGLPLIMRRRFPGEVLVLIGCGLAFVLTFAI